MFNVLSITNSDDICNKLNSLTNYFLFFYYSKNC